MGSPPSSAHAALRVSGPSPVHAVRDPGRAGEPGRPLVGSVRDVEPLQVEWVREPAQRVLYRELVGRTTTSGTRSRSTARRDRSVEIMATQERGSAASPDTYPSFSRCRAIFCAASSAVNSAVSRVISASSGAS